LIKKAIPKGSLSRGEIRFGGVETLVEFAKEFSFRCTSDE
jgi:hypothetical protein